MPTQIRTPDSTDRVGFTRGFELKPPRPQQLRDRLTSKATTSADAGIRCG
jgi:hypothetical protein